jgi:exopolyphosphatase/guanosine-5'-triphosphate,3'-diphosphate pyrophosphatase
MLQSPQESRAVGADSGAHVNEAVYAALDLGTNNCRLLIAASQPPGESQNGLPAPAIRVYDSFSRIVRLGEGVSATGMLSDDAMERTLSALQACQKKLNKYRLADTRFVATEACRRAGNGREFLDRVNDETGIHIDIISSEEEARLAFVGCSSLLNKGTKRAIVFDIGGGSTELMWIDVDSVHDKTARPIIDWMSVGCGVMNLADRFGGAGFAELAFEDMVGFLIEKMQAFDHTNEIGKTIEDATVQLLSTSGTVTTLAAIHLDLPRYDRSRIDGITVQTGDIRKTIQKLLAMRPYERFNHPCIGPDRADFRGDQPPVAHRPDHHRRSRGARGDYSFADTRNIAD